MQDEPRLPRGSDRPPVYNQHRLFWTEHNWREDEQPKQIYVWQQTMLRSRYYPYPRDLISPVFRTASKPRFSQHFARVD